MRFNKMSFCNLSMVVLIFILSYFFTTFIMQSNFFNESNMAQYKSSFLFQTLFLALVFFVVTFVYTYYKANRKMLYSKSQHSEERDILTENEKLKSSLTIDLLTNVANKKYFEERFDEEYKRAMREKQHLSLMIVNIDEFRAFSDIYGRHDGDECLKLVANILVGQCNRPSDLVARVDKDEFYILLPNTNEPKIVSQKCVKAVHGMQIPHENSIASNVLTITIGTSTVLPEDIIEKNQLILNAQTSLQNAKRSGRNRVH